MNIYLWKRYESLDMKMIRPYLRDLINDHKPTMEPNNKENGSKIQLVIQNNCISTKNFEDTCSIYSASEPVEIFLGSDTNETIDELFNTLLQRFQKAIVTSQINGNKFTHESVNKGATINPKNEKDNKCFQWSTISGLNYNKIKEKDLKKILKLKRIIPWRLGKLWIKQYFSCS